MKTIFSTEFHPRALFTASSEGAPCEDGSVVVVVVVPPPSEIFTLWIHLTFYRN